MPSFFYRCSMILPNRYSCHPRLVHELFGKAISPIQSIRLVHNILRLFQVHLLLSSEKHYGQMAERASSKDSSSVRLHLPASPLSSYSPSETFQSDFGPSSTGSHPISGHDCQVPSKFGQFGRVWCQGVLHGSGQSFYFQKQGANGGVLG